MQGLIRNQEQIIILFFTNFINECFIYCKDYTSKTKKFNTQYMKTEGTSEQAIPDGFGARKVAHFLLNVGCEQTREMLQIGGGKKTL